MKTTTTNMLLAGSKSNDSVDQPMYVNVDLTGKNKAFKKAKIDDTIDLYSLYKAEKDSCTRYRLLFVINPVCTNILFNKKTEVVAFEGSDKCVALSDYTPLNMITGVDSDLLKMVDRAQNNAKSALYLYDTIRDTEFSHPDLGNFTYHCGADMCNNHIMRSKEFAFSNYVTAKSTDDSKNGFNTISDICRTENGSEEENFTGLVAPATSSKAHMYGVDTIMTFNESYLLNLYEKDGWIGFDNTSTIHIDNVEYKDGNLTKRTSVNSVINNISPCSFIDLYPDRTLFSAVPKYNEYRHRQEHNWDYCITYPYRNEKDKLYEINGHKGSKDDNGYLGMKMEVYKVMYTSNGEKVIVFKTSVNHNLHVGKYINLYLQKPIGGGKYETIIHNERIQVVGVGLETGLEKEKYFSVRDSDMPSGRINETDEGIFLIERLDETYYDVNKNGTGGKVLFSYRNNVNNTPCDYYIRVFKKVKSKEIDSYTGEPKDLTYDVSKLAFGVNIYGDDMAQVIFNEDIDLTGLRDNRGRELSEIFLTMIKTNRGHDLWYKRSKKNILQEKVIEEIKNKQKEEIEFSHCFGKVTSGIEINDDSEDYNIYKLHNIHTDKLPNSPFNIMDTHGCSTEDGLLCEMSLDDNGISFKEGTVNVLGAITPPKMIEDDITIKNNEFYGDIVEFNPNDYTETVLAKIYYRFNTEQRECYQNEEYFNIFQDELVSDDFDGITIESKSGATGADTIPSDSDRKFKVETTLQNLVETYETGGCSNNTKSTDQIKHYLMAGNLNPEGYYYSPHNRIVVKELTDDVSEASVNRLNIDKNSIDDNFVVLNDDSLSTNVAVVKLLSPRLYDFQKGENIMFYNWNTQKTVFGTIDTVIGRQSILVKIIQSEAISDVIDKNTGKVKVDKNLLPEESMLFKPNANGVYKISDDILVLYTSITVPNYAVYRGSTSSYVWRGPIKTSEVTSASTLYNVPFSNGAIYIEKNVNLFLKRQDPQGINYLYNYDERPSIGNGEKGNVSSTASAFLRKEGMPKLDLRYLLEGDIDITLDLC